MKGITGEAIRNARILAQRLGKADAAVVTRLCDEAVRINDEVESRASSSWYGVVDRQSGAFDPNDRHEMGG